MAPGVVTQVMEKVILLFLLFFCGPRRAQGMIGKKIKSKNKSMSKKNIGAFLPHQFQIGPVYFAPGAVKSPGLMTASPTLISVN